MSRPEWLIRLHNPGGLLWWPGYLAWKWFKICWTAHRICRVQTGDDCDMFWDAEEFGMQLRRNPGLWDELEPVELIAPPKACLYGNASTSGDKTTVMAMNATENSYTLTCLCGRH